MHLKAISRDGCQWLSNILWTWNLNFHSISFHRIIMSGPTKNKALIPLLCIIRNLFLRQMLIRWLKFWIMTQNWWFINYTCICIVTKLYCTFYVHNVFCVYNLHFIFKRIQSFKKKPCIPYLHREFICIHLCLQ